MRWRPAISLDTTMVKQNSITAFLKGVYHDDFKWALVKSIGFFALGIRIAQEFHGVELLSPQP
jgi:hypothetical protein